MQSKKLIALILAGLMTLSAVSCAKGDDTVETDDTNTTQVESEEDTGYKPNIRKQNYKGTSKNSSHDESMESFPPELCSDIVTKIFRRGSTLRADFCCAPHGAY